MSRRIASRVLVLCVAWACVASLSAVPLAKSATGDGVLDLTSPGWTWNGTTASTFSDDTTYPIVQRCSIYSNLPATPDVDSLRLLVGFNYSGVSAIIRGLIQYPTEIPKYLITGSNATLLLQYSLMVASSIGLEIDCYETRAFNATAVTWNTRPGLGIKFGHYLLSDIDDPYPYPILEVPISRDAQPGYVQIVPTTTAYTAAVIFYPSVRFSNYQKVCQNDTILGVQSDVRESFSISRNLNKSVSFPVLGTGNVISLKFATKSSRELVLKLTDTAKGTDYLVPLAFDGNTNFEEQAVQLPMYNDITFDRITVTGEIEVGQNVVFSEFSIIQSGLSPLAWFLFVGVPAAVAGIFVVRHYTRVSLPRKCIAGGEPLCEDKRGRIYTDEGGQVVKDAGGNKVRIVNPRQPSERLERY